MECRKYSVILEKRKNGPWTMSDVIEPGFNLKFNDLLASIELDNYENLIK